MLAERILRAAIALIYGQRTPVFLVLIALTAVLGWRGTLLQPDAGFEKQIPLGHPYMQTFKEYEKAFGGANLVSIALINTAGDIYDETFLDRLKKLTDATFFLPGVDRTRVSSLFTPDLVYLEIVEGGLEFRNIVPRNYTPSDEAHRAIRERVEKAGIIGRYVSSDQRGAMIVAELLERHPVSGEKLDYHRLAGQLEDQLRQRLQSPVMYEYTLLADRAPYRAGDLVWRGYTDHGWQTRHRVFEAERLDDEGRPIRFRGEELAVTAVPNPDHAPDVDVHIIGFAKVVGDVTDASTEVVGYFFIALLLTGLLLWLFCGSFRLSLLPLSAAVVAVVWEQGLLELAGFGLDPFAILVPFLILSVGVSHGVQYINGWGHEVAENGRSPYDASLETFKRLFIPGTVAIVTDVIGFATLAFIQIEIVQEMAINAAMGMAAVIVTNKVMLPIVLTWVRVPDLETFRRRALARQHLTERLWTRLDVFATARAALPTLLVSLGLLALALSKYPDLRVGDVQAGVPELKPDGRYNRDAAAIVGNFNIGVDVLKVIAETGEYGCVNPTVVETIDRFTWHMQNQPGVQSALSLTTVAREIRGLFNEGVSKWKVLPRSEGALSQLTGKVPTASGLQNPDCSRMPILIFTTDHKAETLAGVIAAAKRFNEEARGSGVNFALASGNAGVMAATNEEIEARELLVIIWVHATLGVFAWLSFRTLTSVVAILTPLVLCSLMTYGFMAQIGIGMKASTLPVAAFGVGIGVDYSIYLWSVLAHYREQGLELRAAFHQALRHTGKAVVFTSLSLLIAVFTWLFSGLQFQADMGLLLLFMFSTNLLGAILLLPALAWLCERLASPRERITT